MPPNLDNGADVAIEHMETSMEYLFDRWENDGVRVFQFYGTTVTTGVLTSRGMKKIFFIINLGHELLMNGKTIRQNSAKYMYDELFGEDEKYSSFHLYFKKTSRICDLPRRSFGFVSEVDGEVFGNVSIEIINNGDPELFEDEEVVETLQCNSKRYNYNIDDECLCRQLKIKNFETEYRVKSIATSILIVEKGGVYQWLVDDNFHAKHNCILICSHGSPAMNTIAFVYTLREQLDIPVYGLNDLNPSGTRLMNEFYYSDSRCSAEKYISVAVLSLGMRPTQLAHVAPRNDLTTHDIATMRFLLSTRSKFLEYGNPVERMNELLAWQHLRIKTNLEAWQEMSLLDFAHRIYPDAADSAI